MSGGVNEGRLQSPHPRNFRATLGPALCAAATVALMAIWVRSYFVSDRVLLLPSGGDLWSTGWSRGEIEMQWTSRESVPQVAGRSGVFWMRFPPSPGGLVKSASLWTTAGFYRVVDESHMTVIMPLWLPTLMASSPAIVLFAVGRRAKRRARRGLCIRCGYDLRGSGERCSECGCPISRAQKS